MNRTISRLILIGLSTLMIAASISAKRSQLLVSAGSTRFQVAAQATPTPRPPFPDPTESPTPDASPTPSVSPSPNASPVPSVSPSPEASPSPRP